MAWEAGAALRHRTTYCPTPGKGWEAEEDPPHGWEPPPELCPGQTPALLGGETTRDLSADLEGRLGHTFQPNVFQTMEFYLQKTENKLHSLV